jgi:hypothetical protein
MGPLRVTVQADEELFQRWLAPALSQTLSADPDQKEAPLRIYIGVGHEIGVMKRLSSWVGTGVSNGIYESCEASGNTLLFDHASQLWAFWSPAHVDAHVWLASLDFLPPWEFGAPLKALLHWMCGEAGLQLIHGGAVGRETGGVLLAGPGGAGKSTTALACLGSGLKYLADDYCLIEPGSPPVAHQLYADAKLRPENLHRFEKLRANFAWEPDVAGAKPLMFLNDAWRDHMALRLPLQAIVMPHVSGAADTTWKRGSSAAAWRALAPSTMWQLPARKRETFESISSLSRSLPVYELHVGTNLRTIPGAIESVLADAAANPV